MEVEVIDFDGIAPDAVVMIRASQMRRQAKFSAQTMFQFPALPLNAFPFKIEIYEPMGGKSLALSEDAEHYVVRVPGHADGAFDASTLEIRVAEQRGPGGPPQQSDGLDDLGEDVEPQPRQTEATAAAKGYLQRNGLVGYIQGMLGELIKVQPDDPFAYMGDVARPQRNLPEPPSPLPAAPSPADGNEVEKPMSKEVPPFAVDVTMTEGAGNKWYVRIQRPFALRGERCMLTVVQNDEDGLVRVNAVRDEDQALATASSTVAEFDGLCAKVGAPKVDQAAASLLEAASFSCCPSPDFRELQATPDPGASGHMELAAELAELGGDAAINAHLQDLHGGTMCAASGCDEDTRPHTVDAPLAGVAQENEFQQVPAAAGKPSPEQVLLEDAKVDPPFEELGTEGGMLFRGSQNSFISEHGSIAAEHAAHHCNAGVACAAREMIFPGLPTTDGSLPMAACPAPPQDPPGSPRNAPAGPPPELPQEDAKAVPPPVGSAEQGGKMDAPTGPPAPDMELKDRNNDLAAANQALRQEIERLQRALASDADAIADSQRPSADQEKTLLPPSVVHEELTSDKPPEAPEPAPEVLASPDVADDGAAIDFNEALDATVSGLYEELQRNNLELRGSYNELAADNNALKAEREQMRTTLMRICYGLEELVIDIRSSAGEPAPVKPPPRGNDLEDENQKLGKANEDLFSANRKLRKDNEVLQSELSSRQATRVGTRSNSRGAM